MVWLEDSKDSQSVPKGGLWRLPRNCLKANLRLEAEGLPEENLKGAFTPSVGTFYVSEEPPAGHFDPTIQRLAPHYDIVPLMPYRQNCTFLPGVATAHASA